jgi:hypothetical protein
MSFIFIVVLTTRKRLMAKDVAAVEGLRDKARVVCMYTVKDQTG